MHRFSVLALHGFLGSGADWMPVARRVEAPLVMPDLPGHGDSVGLATEAYTLEAAADALVADLDARQLDQVVVAGYSMGGRLGLHLTLRHPDRVAGLLLLSASPGLKTEADRVARRQLDAERAAAIQHDLPGFLDRWYRADLWGHLPEDRRRQLVEQRSRNAPDELAKSLRGMGAGAQAWLGDRLREIGVSGVVAVGARDVKYVALAQEMAAASSLRPVLIPDVGHALLAEAPDSVAHLLTDLLSSLDG